MIELTQKQQYIVDQAVKWYFNSSEQIFQFAGNPGTGKSVVMHEIANRLNEPIVIHTRDAYIDTIEILKKHQVNKKGIFHCCPLNQELIKEGLKLGFYISFSGNITFKNAKAEAILELVPMDKMLIETDSPYLTPEPFRGKRNNPSMVKLVAQRVSEVKKVRSIRS